MRKPTAQHPHDQHRGARLPEPRVPHAAERRAGHGAPAGRHAAERRAADLCHRPARKRRASAAAWSTTCWISPSWARARSIAAARPMIWRTCCARSANCSAPGRRKKAWRSPGPRRPAIGQPGRRGPAAQILLNLAGNAVKFTEAGGVLVSVGRGAGGRLRFVVEDTGPGVPKATREQIFEAFAQAGPAHGVAGRRGPGPGHRPAARPRHGRRQWASRSRQGRRRGLLVRGGLRAAWRAARSGRLAGRPPWAWPRPTRSSAEAARRQIAACGAQRGRRRRGREACWPTTRRRRAAAGSRPGRRRAGRCGRPPAHGRSSCWRRTSASRIARYRAAGFAGYLIKPLRRDSLAERVLAAAERRRSGRRPPPEDERDRHGRRAGARVPAGGGQPHQRHAGPHPAGARGLRHRSRRRRPGGPGRRQRRPPTT